jgi:hypothetical protein
VGLGDGDRSDDGGVGRGAGLGTVDVLTSSKGVVLVDEGGVGKGASVEVGKAGEIV